MTSDSPLTPLERDLQRAYAATPSEALRRHMDARVGRTLALAPGHGRRRRWMVVALAASVLLLAGAGFYVALQAPKASVLDSGQPLACSGLLGGTPETAAVDLAQRGYRVVWTRETTDPKDAAFGFAERVETMPAGVVLDIVVRGSEAEVRVTPRNDPLAATAAARAEAERSACP